jgi:hypothetical protein
MSNVVVINPAANGRQPRSGMNKFCTMIKSTSICKLPAAKGRGYKWPKLEELYQFLFNKKFDGAHDAAADVKAAAECFFAMVARGDIKLDEYRPVEKTADVPVDDLPFD